MLPLASLGFLGRGVPLSVGRLAGPRSGSGSGSGSVFLPACRRLSHRSALAQPRFLPPRFVHRPPRLLVGLFPCHAASPLTLSSLRSLGFPLRSSSTLAPPRLAVHSSLSSPILSRHLFLVAGLVFTIVVVGGLTRLTESGLSITEWNLVSGVLPPLSADAWEAEFAKYRATPEGQQLNATIGLTEFQRIYYWEWAHRLLGRVIGLSFLLPLPLLIRAGLVRGRPTGWTLAAIGTLIGAQGGLGWYMVQSGLDQGALDMRDGVPRVSQYRLAAHLLMAFGVYATCVRLAGGVWRDWMLAVERRPLGGLGATALDSARLLQGRLPGRARVLITGLTGLILLTAGSGAFVAGLDAGLVYNTFPKMGERWVPPLSELFSDVYARRSGDPGPLGMVRNVFENPTTVQLDHRLLAGLTFCSTIGWLAFATRQRRFLPPTTLRWARAMGAMACVQVGLGISTLVYLVPTSLAAAHQAGSLVLLTLSLGAGLSLRRPSPQALQVLQRAIVGSRTGQTKCLPPSSIKS